MHHRDVGLFQQRQRHVFVTKQPPAGERGAADQAFACLFLASDDASFVTGTALIADGGARRAAP